MKTHEKQHRCFCTFVPPHILEHMAKSSDEVVRESVREAARLSMIQDMQLRASRAGQAMDIASLLPPQQGIMAPPPATAGREVFNCMNQWGPRRICWRAAKEIRSPQMMISMGFMKLVAPSGTITGTN